ncbi:hypothetical protein GQX74_014793 [Glossina fuscipes]|nr:hypothetical protein GQX74_014793 [Glossina fuscipes]
MNKRLYTTAERIKVILPHRFLLQPFRKPKRVRTAFSPTQLLKLEHAFEENHYVVGAERKQLAQGLSLTETQVKVWFQNRRTKHKRMQQESDSDTKSQKGSTSGDNETNKYDGSQTSFEDQDDLDDDAEEMEDEVIDMDDYDEHGDELSAEERQRLNEHMQEIQNRHFVVSPLQCPLLASWLKASSLLYCKDYYYPCPRFNENTRPIVFKCHVPSFNEGQSKKYSNTFTQISDVLFVFFERSQKIARDSLSADIASTFCRNLN